MVPAENKIITDAEEITYDALVLATGADTNFFGNAKLSENAFPMKSTVEALQLRYRLLQNLEESLTIKDESELQRRMNVVVVGGGPTGVEVSGALAEMKKYILPKEYPELDFSKMNIYLLEGGAKTLAAMSEKSAAQSSKYLRKLGVTVMTHTLVKDYDGKLVSLQDGTTIAANTVIWAAGIKGNVPGGIDKSLIARGNRIKTDRRCRIEGHNNIYAIGDLAYMETPKYPDGHPQVAPVAMQQADMLADNFRRLERKSTEFYDFEYNDKGSMATVGRNLAVVDVPKPNFISGDSLPG
ncbi:MAG: FAD-dependent oxidoreductase [Bacteroidota bacterium]